MRIDETGHDRHVAEIEIGRAFVRRSHPADPRPLIVMQPSSIGAPSTGKTYRAWMVSVSRLIGRFPGLSH